MAGRQQEAGKTADPVMAAGKKRREWIWVLVLPLFIQSGTPGQGVVLPVVTVGLSTY